MNKTASKLASLAAASAIFAATSIASASPGQYVANTINPVVNPGTGAFDFTLHISWADPGSVSNPACRTVMGRTVCSR